MKSWLSFLSFDNNVDGVFRTLSVFVIAIVLIKCSTLFEVEYSSKLIHLYLHPWWRILIVLLLLASSLWCPRVGILMALLVFFYFADMETLITPFSDM